MTPSQRPTMPPNVFAMRGEIDDIREEYRTSDACRLLTRLKVFELTLRIFRGNFGDWQRVIDQYRPASPLAALDMMRRPGRWVEPFLVEITRTLHNFAASAFTLVDHTRNLHNELYSASGALPDYQARVDTEFANDGLALFIKGLRNYCVHYSLPLVGVQLGIQSDIHTGTSTNWGVPLSISKLLAWDGWTARPRAFLQGSGPTIDLATVVRQYRDKVESFQGWFQEQQRSVHRAEYEHQARTRFQIARLLELARFYEVVASLLPGRTPDFSEEELRPVAYEMYEEESRLRGDEVHGNDLEHWFRAIGRLTLLSEQAADLIPAPE